MQYIQPTTEEPVFLEETLTEQIGRRITIHGSIYKIRRMSGFAFILLRMKRQIIQCVYSPELSHFDIHQLEEEDCVRFTADVVAEPRSRTGYELRLIQADILSRPQETPPVTIHNKHIHTSLETLLDYRPLTLRNEKERAIFKIQEGLCQGFRSYLTKQRFTEVHTPKIVPTGAEGGANIFRLDYFGQEAYLAQSPQFYKQMMVGVFERVYEIAPVFRAERHDTSRHLNEYTSVDLEMGYITGFEEIMNMEASMLRYALSHLLENYEAELALLKVPIPTLDVIPVIPFREAKETVSSVYHRPITDWGDFDPEEEKLLCEWILKQTGSELVFVTHYPSSKRPFYAMDDPMDPEQTLSFDLLFRGLEVTTGGQRIHDYPAQLKKMQERGMNVDHFESYLMAHKYGLPPHGGLGLGLERFTSRLLGQSNVRLSTLFPRDIKRITP